MPIFTTIYQCHQSYPFLPVLRESARYVFFKGIRSLSRRRMLFSQTISTPNGAVGSLVRFIFVLLTPPLVFFILSPTSQFCWFFSLVFTRSLPPPNFVRFLFVPPPTTPSYWFFFSPLFPCKPIIS